jgi:hypothetical protein
VNGTAANNKRAIDNAIAELGTTRGGLIYVPRGQYACSGDVAVATKNVTICGQGSGASYEAGKAGTEILFGAGTYGFDFTATSGGFGAATASGLRDLSVNGNNVLTNGVGMKGLVVCENVEVKSCTNAGFYIPDLANQTQLINCSAVSNTYGLLVEGPDSTTFSVHRSNFRLNVKGVKLAAGVNVKFADSVFESNTEEGVLVYYPDSRTMYGIEFDNCWWESNYAGTSNYQLYITSQTLAFGSNAKHIKFRRCNFAATGTARHVNVESARWVTFDECGYTGGDLANGVLLGANTGYVEHIDHDGPTITDNGVNNFTRTRSLSGKTAGWTISGGYTERSRSFAMGEWTTPAFSALNFTANGAMTWTVGAGSVVTYAYTLVGKMMTLSWQISATSTIGGVVNTTLRIAVPGGFTIAKRMVNTGRYYNNAVEGVCMAVAPAAATYVELYKDTIYNATNWVLDAAAGVTGQITFEVQ